MLRLVFPLAFAAMVCAGSGAWAQVTVERSGANFHIAACPGKPPPGRVRCHAHILTDSQGSEIANRFVPVKGKKAGTSTEPFGYGPPSLIAAYNPQASATYPNLGSSTTVIAIIDAKGYKNAEADLAVYRATFGLLPCTTANGCFVKLNQKGQNKFFPVQNLGWARETALDLDMASAMCPNCRLMLIEAKSDRFADLAVAVNLAAAKGATVISNSYGGNESGSEAYAEAYHHPGIAITASSGDKGYNQGPQFPASSPFVTAVGGTSLYPDFNARGWTELAWKDGGSGCSALYAKPAWQAFIPLCPNRMVADVAAVGDPNTGVAVYAPVTISKSAWLIFGGTSVGAPLVAGLYAVHGGPVADGAPYGDTTYLNDVMSGANGVCGNFFCIAGPGYDGPTGLGTPSGPGAF